MITVMGFYNTELGYQRWLKHEAIRAYVQANGGILFDYADILSWDYTNSQRFSESWDGHTWDGINTAYDDASYDGGDGGCHITADACRQLAKGLWVMAAKLAEMDAPTLGIIEGQTNLTADPITTEAPVLASPALDQAHVLEAIGIVVGEPVLQTPVISSGTVVGLEAESIIAGSPELESSALGQVQVLDPNNIFTGTPVLVTIQISQTQKLIADSIVSGAPILGTPILNNPEAVGVVTVNISMKQPRISCTMR